MSTVYCTITDSEHLRTGPLNITEVVADEAAGLTGGEARLAAGLWCCQAQRLLGQSEGGGGRGRLRPGEGPVDGQGAAAAAAASAAAAPAATPKHGHGQGLHLPVQLLQLFLLFP